MTTYSIPVSQTTLTQFEVDVQTVSGDEFTYHIFQDPEEGDHPGFTGTQWLNEDQEKDGIDDMSNDWWFVHELGVLDNVDVHGEEFINNNLQRYHGDGVRIVGDRIEVDDLERYCFIPGYPSEFDTAQEWADENKIDLQVLDNSVKKDSPKENRDDDEDNLVVGNICYYSSIDIKVVHQNGEVLGECVTGNPDNEDDGWLEVANGIALHILNSSDVYFALEEALQKDEFSELAKKIEDIDVYDYEATIEYNQPKLEYSATGQHGQPETYPRDTPGLNPFATNEGDSYNISCSATLVIIPDTEDVEEEVNSDNTNETLAEEEKTPLAILQERTANEHAACVHQLMDAKCGLDNDKIKEAEAALDAVRKRSKEICGMTNEWQVKIEDCMKNQWLEKWGRI